MLETKADLKSAVLLLLHKGKENALTGKLLAEGLMKRRTINQIYKLRVFLITSILLGIIDNILTQVGLSYGLQEGGPLHQLLNPEGVPSNLIGTFGMAILMIITSFLLKSLFLPHILVLIQVINDSFNLILVLAVINHKLLL